MGLHQITIFGVHLFVNLFYFSPSGSQWVSSLCCSISIKTFSVNGDASKKKKKF